MRILDKSGNLVNQLLPFTHTKWAWELYQKGVKNNWVPTDIAMQKDIEQWRGNSLSADEKLVITRCLGFFAGSESLVGNNLLLNIFKYINDGCCRQYISRQLFEETLHNWTIVYICESLALNQKELYQAYIDIPSIKAKDNFLMKLISTTNDNCTTYSEEDLSKILTNLITFYIICEGLLFYTGFASLLSFGRRTLMVGISEQIGYSYRDEQLHVEFGVNLIKTIISQYPELWTPSYQQKVIENIEEAMFLEEQYAKDILPNGILGLNQQSIKDYLIYLGNYRCSQIGLDYKFTNRVVKNPFPWLSEVIELPKMKNFFETRVLDYQTGGLKDDF